MNFCLEESCVSFLNWRAVKMPLSLKPDARPRHPAPTKNFLPQPLTRES
ncbi:hypothetical protein VL20_6494 [Microcystis panniformis FACHB-1757]|uniref:Uncharacterized protein n=1 Tax=Microcystis panniformis FACHB-1757 TaxID=1638788 RepID=A0A0K1SAZ7_9CHRO|nr:hypothetical protein VL20_6494 [Microcystis panniformis FACHB-1757]